MFKNKVFISITIFSVLMFLTAFIKTQTRIIEKNIYSYQFKISELENNLYEAQLEYFYLSSPENLSKKILEYSDDEYKSINFSKIYFSIEDFKKDQRKTSKKVINDKKIQKK
ncbi:MAG: hypothetical protein ACJZ3C_03720 [Pelagibacteraceae bacterium]|tara:strand:- start:10 stop:345 length:336 start_codon:yes stop_codon:yes gene_type:complete